jgi:hypothetical protein
MAYSKPYFGNLGKTGFRDKGRIRAETRYIAVTQFVFSGG